MKTGVSDLPRSMNQGNEFLMLREKKHGIRIEGEGFVVREWRFSDCDSLAENANNEKIWNNVMDHFPHPYTKQDAFDYISMVHAMPAPSMRFAIEVDGKAVGSIGFGSEGDIERVTAEIGYWLGEPYWGRGIMPRVVAAVTQYAFETFGYQKLYALVFDYNPGSMRVLEKAGYQLEAVLHKAAVKNGKVIDFYYYSIMKEN